MFDVISKIVELRMITNIVLGIILFFVLKIFFQWIYEIYCIRKLKRANAEIVALLKPYASSEVFPAQETFKAMMGAVANDYHVRYEDLNSLTYYFQEFIKEIMEDGYIPLDKKVEYTDNLRHQMELFEEHKVVQQEVSEVVDGTEQKRSHFYNNNLMNLSIFISSLLVAGVGYISQTYDFYSAVGIFVVVAFALFIFADICLKRKRYRDIPKLFTYINRKIRESWQQRKLRRAEEKKAKEEEQYNQEKQSLEEEQANLVQLRQQLDEAQQSFQMQQQRLAEEYEIFNAERAKFEAESNQISNSISSEVSLVDESMNQQELVAVEAQVVISEHNEGNTIITMDEVDAVHDSAAQSTVEVAQPSSSEDEVTTASEPQVQLLPDQVVADESQEVEQVDDKQA